MKRPVKFIITVLFLFFAGNSVFAENIYKFKLKSISGKTIPLSLLKGKVILIVNVASYCGFTYQYNSLQKLYNKYRKKGLVILGFPSNDFGNEEPGSNTDIRKFSHIQYRVEFPLMSKVRVKGKHIHPLYRYLIHHSRFKSDIRWNFEKFLIDRKGNVVARIPSPIEPDSTKVVSLVESLLKQDESNYSSLSGNYRSSNKD
ncbi:MAG: glutathione peroxidase [Leptospiraceae bacterium]|nr:glutathione peroxidase [Leptospiraceae bacterium]MCP5499372.1 glutathione peroxidase [Leptospiraceae bacterium]